MGRPSHAETQRRRDRVLEVARAAFIRNGYRATKMDAIAAEADVSKRTLYLWHADKAALFRLCVVESARLVSLPPLDDRKSVEDALSSYATAMHREFSTGYAIGMARLLAVEGREFPEIAEAVQQGRAFITQPLLRYFRRHGLETETGSDSVVLFQEMILSLLQPTVYWNAPLLVGAKLKQRIRMIVGVFLHGRRNF